MKFPDAAYYGSVDAWNAVMNHEAADDFAYYVGGNIALHPWPAGDVARLRTGSRRGMGVHVTTVAGRDGAADGAYFGAWNKNVYGAGDGDPFALDLEPVIYRADPAAALAYARAWAAAVRAVAAAAELAASPPVPQRAVVGVSVATVTLACWHVLARSSRFERKLPLIGDRFPCHDCAMEGRS